MDLAHLLAFNAALLAAMASPGPALLLLIRATLRGGRRAGMATGAGLALVAAGWTLAALLGLDGAFRLFPAAFAALKAAGALYLLWIAVQTWRQARAPLAGAGAEPRSGAGRAFLDGVLVNLGNPKSVLFAAAVLVVIFPPGLPLAACLGIAANHLAVEVAVYAALAALLSRAEARRGYLALKPVLDRATALVLGALGLRLLLDGRP